MKLILQCDLIRMKATELITLYKVKVAEFEDKTFKWNLIQ